MRFDAAGEDARKIAGNAAAGNVGESGDPAAGDDIFERGSVAKVRLQKLGADFVADFGDVGIGFQLGDFENELAGERVTIGVQTGGRKSDERIAGFYIFSGEELFAFDGANDEAGKIVFTGRIEAGHLGGFTADERAARFAAGAAHAFDELLDNFGLEFPHRKIVEKEKRFSALDENVVDAMIDEIAADGGVDIHGHGDLEFCADAIGAGNKDRFLPFFGVEGEERAEATDAAENS